MGWVVITLQHDGDPSPEIVQVVECESYLQAVRLVELRVGTLKEPMWTHHLRRSWRCEGVPA